MFQGLINGPQKRCYRDLGAYSIFHPQLGDNVSNLWEFKSRSSDSTIKFSLQKFLKSSKGTDCSLFTEPLVLGRNPIYSRGRA